MSKKHLIRLISGAATISRQLCTEAEAAELAMAKTAGSPKPLLGRVWRSAPGSVKKTLDDYLREGISLTNLQLINCVKRLRKSRKFHLALETMEWMESRRMKFGHAEYATRLDLMAKTKGILAAEEYFKGLLPVAKDRTTYGSLLNCYCKELMEEKAFEVFRKMDEMGFLNSPLAFNNLMALYLQLGQPRKVLELVNEMKLRKVCLDTYTCIMWMQSCGSLNDYEGVERVLEELKIGDGYDLKITWTTYSNLATIYLRAGEFEKVDSALKMLEAHVGPNDTEAYHFMISTYAVISNLNEVYRVWNLLNLRFRVAANSSYLVLFIALAKLDDVEGITKWFKKWESSCNNYDSRIAYQVIKAYLDHDMHEEAVSVFEVATERCERKLLKAREIFMVYLLKKRQLVPALEHLKVALSEAKNVGAQWQPEERVIDAFFNYLEEKEDVDGAEKLCKILCMDSNAFLRLLKIYVAAGKDEPTMRQRLEENSIEISPDLESLLQKVCLA